MSQQLNLYGPSFRRSKGALCARNALLALALVVSVCLLIGGVLTWRTSFGRVDAKEQQAFVEHQARVQDLQAQVAAQRQAVEQEAAKLREVEQAVARVKASLQGGAASGSTVSYAAYFEALAKQSHASLWLTGFVVSPDGQSIELKGRMLDASALPNYLSRLNAEPIFKGRQFAQLQLSSVATEGADVGPRVTEFVLRTASAQDSKEPTR